MRINKQAFTLIEVLVSVAIITFIGTVLLKIVSNNTYFISTILQKSKANSFISIFSDFGKTSNNKDLSIQEILDDKYSLLARSLEDEIRDKTIKYKDELLSTVFLLDLGEEKDEVVQSDDKQTLPNSKIDIRKKIIIIKNENDKKTSLEYLYYLTEHENDEAL